MEEKFPPKNTRSLFTRWLIFHRSKPFVSWGIILGVFVVFSGSALLVAGVTGYVAYDYIQRNPRFCITCHDIMIESYEKWEKSEHAEVNCHACHHLSPEEAINYGIQLMNGMPDKIPPRPEGKIIVPSNDCMNCHWKEKKEVEGHGSKGIDLTNIDLTDIDLTDIVIQVGQKIRAFLAPAGPDGNNVASSRFHAIHYFNGQTECFTCHGHKELHVFTPAPEDCLDCHESQQEKAHAAKGIKLECLNCHTDRTANFHPNREKCLFCHGEDDGLKQQLVDAGTIDVKYHQPSEEIVASASHIHLPDSAPMQQFDCSTCHQPHQEETAVSKDTCISCHPKIEQVGQHALHMSFFQGDCLQCHQPHSWTITEEQAQEKCTACHEYRDPLNFIQPSQK